MRTEARWQPHLGSSHQRSPKERSLLPIEPGTAPANTKRAAFESLAKPVSIAASRPLRWPIATALGTRANGYISGASCILSFMSAAFTDSGTLVAKSVDFR